MLTETCIVGQYFLDHKFYAALLVTSSLPSRLAITNDVGTNKCKKFRLISRRLYAWPLTYQPFNRCNVDVCAGTTSCVNVSISTRVSNKSKLWRILYTVRTIRTSMTRISVDLNYRTYARHNFKPYQLEWHPHPTLFSPFLPGASIYGAINDLAACSTRLFYSKISTEHNVASWRKIKWNISNY